MDAMVLAAMQKWPNVPAVFGWLRLDTRGQWWLQDERIEHPGLLDFLVRNYGHDDHGRYFVQNGPQRVYVNLDAAPYSVRRLPAGWLASPAIKVGRIRLALLDEQGQFYFEDGERLLVLDDRDLLGLSAMLRRADSQIEPDADDWPLWLAGEQAWLLHLPEGALPVLPVESAGLACAYGIALHPVP